MPANGLCLSRQGCVRRCEWSCSSFLHARCATTQFLTGLHESGPSCCAHLFWIIFLEQLDVFLCHCRRGCDLLPRLCGIVCLHQICCLKYLLLFPNKLLCQLHQNLRPNLNYRPFWTIFHAKQDNGLCQYRRHRDLLFKLCGTYWVFLKRVQSPSFRPFLLR